MTTTPREPADQVARLRAELAEVNTAIRAARQAFDPDRWKRLVAHAGGLSVQIATLTTQADPSTEMEPRS